MISLGKQKNLDMTNGSIAKLILGFALPLLLGNAFQQFYNTVDSWVVGNYVSSAAFSAVGTITPVVNLFVSFFTGMSTGSGVIISHAFGSGRENKVSTAVHNGFLIILVMGVFLTVICFCLTPVILRFMNTPDDVFAEANTYMQIYCCGLIFLTVYNQGAAVLRAVGDSRRPTLFLVVTALVNIVLDLLFVLAFHMGVAGVAWATVVAEAVSMVLVMIVLIREKSAIRFRFSELFKADFSTIKQIINIGIPAGVQSAIISFSNVFVHAYINYFGSGMMGGYAAYMKVEKFAQLPIQSLQLALTTFVGQNLGAGNIRRAREGVRTTMGISFLFSGVICVLMYFASPALVEFFNPDPEVIRIGTWVIRFMIPFTLLHVPTPVFAGALRGARESRSIMLMMIGSYCVFRQIYLYLMTTYVANTETVVVFGVGVAWLVATIAIGIYYFARGKEIFYNAVPAESRDRIIL